MTQASDIKKALLISVITTVIVSAAVWGSATYAKSSCLSKGGEIITVKGDNKRLCAMKYLDAGKECTTSLDCQGRCYIQEEGQNPTCEKDNNPLKCIGTLSAPPICKK